MKIAIFGNSNQITYDEFDSLIKEKVKFDDEIVCGNPTHINKLSEMWAERNRIKKEILNIDFKTCGRNASHYNKKKIIKECDVCLIIGGQSGTYVNFCQELEKKVEILNFS